jgi:lysine 6-dehydrogenase
MDLKDYGIIKISAEGKRGGKECSAVLELIDEFDNETGFTSMQRLTGWHASSIAILSAKGEVTKGAVPVEKAVSGKVIYQEMEKRGIKIREKFYCR